MALELAKNPTVLIVNDTVFAHGGLLPLHVSYGLERLNQEVSAWMRADRTEDGGEMARWMRFHQEGKGGYFFCCDIY
jgi:hypothetical protein